VFELVPGTGVVLPGRAGLLRFGMSEREAQWAAATLADVRDHWVCGAGWAFSACYEGLVLSASGDHLDRLGRPEHDRPGLADVTLRRREPAPARAAAVPVVLQDIDVLGYPAQEVLAALGPGLPAEVRLLADPGAGGYLQGALLRAG
jgi:hypothetical protein